MNTFKTFNHEWSRLRRAKKLYLLPIGSYEPHKGLPWDLDTRIAVKVAQILSERLRAEVLPPLPYSLSFEWEGSISLRIETLASILRDINDSINGTLVVINAHGGNSGALQAIGRQEGFYVLDLLQGV